VFLQIFSHLCIILDPYFICLCIYFYMTEIPIFLPFVLKTLSFPQFMIMHFLSFTIIPLSSSYCLCSCRISEILTMFVHDGEIEVNKAKSGERSSLSFTDGKCRECLGINEINSVMLSSAIE